MWEIFYLKFLRDSFLAITFKTCVALLVIYLYSIIIRNSFSVTLTFPIYNNIL